VFRIRVTRAGKLAPGQVFSGPRPGDQFGAAVAASPRGGEVIVGAPGTDVGGAADAGAAYVFAARGDRLVSRRLIVEGRGGLSGESAAGDRLGAAVAIGTALRGCQEATQWAAGVPGEDLRRRRDAGAVYAGLADRTPFGRSAQAGAGCATQRLFAGAGLPGQPAAGARLGAALGVARYRDDFDEDIYDGLIVGVPGAGRLIVNDEAFRVPRGPQVIAVPELGFAF
jgi:hypothetical protein